jgi:lysyl-tRNA synthetase class 2
MSRGLDRQKAEAALKRAAHKAVHGTREERSGRVISSVITELKYDQQSNELDIRFITGKIYRYSGVPPEVYEAFSAALSKGKFYNALIRDGYSYYELAS